MSEVVGEGIIRIKTDESGVDVSGAGKRAGEGYSHSFLGGIKGLAIGIGAVLASRKILDFAKDSVAEARESQKVGAATTAVIKATGGAANLSAAQIGNLSTALSNKIGVDDEAIQSGANLLLTFKGVRDEVGKGNDIFTRATAAGADLAATGFGSITGNAKTLGKALNDPVKGVTALSRAGVQFTDVQKAQIAGFVKNNDLLSAQKIVLGEVEKQVGGVAAATATSGEKASVAYSNIKESLGTKLLPILDKVEGAFANKVAPAIQSFIAGTSPLNPIVDKIGATIRAVFTTIVRAVGPVFTMLTGLAKQAIPVVLSAVKGLKPVFDTVSATLREIATQRLGELRSAFTALAPVVLGLAKSFVSSVVPVIKEVVGLIATKLVPVLLQIEAAIVAAVVPILVKVGTLFSALLPKIASFVGYVIAKMVPVLVQIGQIIATQVIPALAAIADFIITTVVPAVVQIVQTVLTKLQPVFTQLVATFQQDVLPTLSSLVQTIRTQLLPALEPVIKKVLVVVGVVLKLAAAILGKVLPPLLKLVGFLIRNLVPIIAKVIVILVKVVDKVLGFGGALIKGAKNIGHFAGALVGLVKDGIGGVLSAITGLPGKITGLAGDMLHAGKRLIGAFINGLKGAGGFIGGLAGSIFGAVKGLINGAIDQLNGFLDFSIPIPHAPDISIHAGVIPHLQRGTSNAAPGRTLVGEAGPEVVTLPAGARVASAAMTSALGGGAGVYVHQLVAHDYQDFTRQVRDRQRLASVGGRRVPA